MKKSVVIAILVLFIGLVAWQVRDRLDNSGNAGSGQQGPRPVPVSLEPVRTMNLSHVAEFTGTLEAGARFVVAPKVSGRLEKLHVDIGDRVANGRVVAELDSHEYAQEVSEAQAALEVARATIIEARSELDVARRDLARSQSLRRSDAVSQSELDQALAEFESGQARLQVAEAQVRQQEAALEAARVRLNYTRIAARWDGADQERVVGERFIDEGDMINSNDPIVSVVSLDNLLAVINVVERDFPFIEPGQPAEIFVDAHPGRAFQGRVARLAPVLQEASRQARVEILVPNEQRLIAPGMFVRVRLTFAEHVNATAVPAAALARRDDKQGVFVAVDGDSRARFVPLTPGISDNGWVEVPGEAAKELADARVVTLGKHLLEDGGAISPSAPDARSAKE